MAACTYVNHLIAVDGPVNSAFYAGLGDRHQMVVDGVTTNYTLDLAAGLTQVLANGTNTYLYGNGRIAQTGSTTEYFLGDALGSVRQLADPNGAVTLTQSYAPYGDVVSSVGTSQTDYAFTGEMGDASGLTYLRARYYAPQDGRFISRDTWNGVYERPLSLNRWGYVEENPVTYIDPTGDMRCPWDPMQECTPAEIIAVMLGPFFRLLGVPDGRNVSIPTIGSYHTTGTPAKVFLQETGPGLALIGDTGLSMMGGGGNFYDSYNAILGYNALTGRKYTNAERILGLTFGSFGCLADFSSLKLFDVIEFGSGFDFKNATVLIEEAENGKVLMTEIPLPPGVYENLPGYKAALESGVSIRGGYGSLAEQGYRTTKSVAIAPLPTEAELVARVMSDVTLPGGEIFVAAVEKQTANKMANVFASRFGVNISITEVFSSSIPYQSDFLHDGYLINFIVPGQ